jgi:hypothetical protein
MSFQPTELGDPAAKGRAVKTSHFDEPITRDTPS